MSRRTFSAEFLAASALHALCLLWVFHSVLLNGHVDSLQGRAAIPSALTGMSEMVYITQPILSSQVEFLQKGIFPSWSPYSQAGTPLIGKMQGGVFSPYHLPLYILPRAWLPYALSLAVAIKIYLAFAFAYLFARCLRLNFFPAFLAGTLFVFSHLILGKVFTWAGGGLYLPLLLLLTELCFREQRKAALFLLPWAVAFSFFSGHFESAFRNNLVAGIYFLARLWKEPAQAPGLKINRLVDYGAVMLLGGLLAAVQIAPAVEYNHLSYNKVWHTPKWFNILEYDLIGKHLSGEDAAMLALGCGALGLFVFLLVKSLRCERLELGLKGACAAALALAVAALANVGLNDSLSQFPFLPGAPEIAQWLLGLSLVAFSFWSWAQNDHHPGLDIMGGILIGSILVICKMPLLVNAVSHAPLIGNFHNTTYRWEFNLALGLLAAAGWQKCYASFQLAWDARLKKALRFFIFLCVFVVGYLASQPLKGFLIQAIGTAVPPVSPLENPALSGAGGFMGPELPVSFNNRGWTLAGWVGAYPPPSSISLAVLQGNQPVVQTEAAINSLGSGGRAYFHTWINLPEFMVGRVFARVNYTDKPSRMLRGPQINSQKRQWERRGDFLLLAGLLLLPAVFLLGGWGLKLGYVLVLAAALWPAPFEGIAADQMPYSLPGIAKIKEDKELFRTYSLDYYFLQADYPNMYGLADLRTGGDALDLLTMIYFSQILNSFLADPQAPLFETGLRLLGLANVKYLMDGPGKAAAHPGLTIYYQGTDMTVFKNKYFMPRALFYDQFTRLPLDNFLDWGSRGRFLGPIAGWITQQKPDFQKMFLLNDSPKNISRPSAAREPGLVTIDEYSPNKITLSVSAPRTGFVALSDNFFPGWEAFINGQKTRILRSWITFRAVEVPAGKSSVVFVYRPLMLHLGALLSALLALGWAFFYRRYRLARTPLDAALWPPPPLKNKKAQAQQATREPGAEEAALCAALIEPVFLSLIGVFLLYWTLWSAFIYSESPMISAAAKIILASAAIIFARDWKNGRYTKTAQSS